MAEKLSPRAEAEAIEAFGDSLAAALIAFDRLFDRMSYETRAHVNAIPSLEHLDTIAEAFRSLGDVLCKECEERAEADDLRRGNLFEPDYRRFGPK